MRIHPREDLVHRFFAGTGPSYDFMVNLCTFGCDQWWKRKILSRIPPRSLEIMDQASGTGILTFKIAQKFPRCRIVGVELRREYAHIAREKAVARRIRNVEFIVGGAEQVVLNTHLDCITSSYLAKYVEMESLVKNAGQMLKKNGLLIMHDFTYPPDRLFARVWELYFRILQTAASRVYPRWRTIFYELPQLLRSTRWVTELIECLRKSVFTDITLESLTLGTAAIVTARKA
jgi:demethylmenaquinone methyltransferase/2-methoxy-6-polyprenyl-1,4-benzoquinol methylase